MAGRPTKMTPEVVAKLEEAFSNGASDIEACFLADISKDALYDYQTKNPAFTDRKAALKEMPKYLARKNIIGALRKGDLNQSNWYAERKIKEEFSTRSELTGKDGEQLVQPILVKFIDHAEPNDNRDTDRV